MDFKLGMYGLQAGIAVHHYCRTTTGSHQMPCQVIICHKPGLQTMHAAHLKIPTGEEIWTEMLSERAAPRDASRAALKSRLKESSSSESGDPNLSSGCRQVHIRQHHHDGTEKGVVTCGSKHTPIPFQHMLPWSQIDPDAELETASSHTIGEVLPICSLTTR